MTARAPDMSDTAAIRQAVAFGRQAAVREILDLLAEARRDAVPSTPQLGSAAQRRAWVQGRSVGMTDAARVVRSYRIDPREDPS